MPVAVAVTQLDQQIEWAGVGHPGRRTESQQRLGIDRDRQPTRFIVGHPADPQPATRTRFSTIEFGTQSTSAVLALRAMSASGKPADEQVLDLVTVERGQDPVRVEGNIDFVSHRPQQARGSH